jgi:hypothetical protein
MKLHCHFSIGIYFRQYSSAHNNDIVEFVVRHGAYDMVMGNGLWMMMEEKKVRQSKVNISHSGHLIPECHTHHQVVGGCLGLRAEMAAALQGKYLPKASYFTE